MEARGQSQLFVVYQVPSTFVALTVFLFGGSAVCLFVGLFEMGSLIGMDLKLSGQQAL